MPETSLESLLRDLRAGGIDVIYSSELVTPQMTAPPLLAGDTPLQRVREALASQGLALRALGPDKYVVVRAPQAPVVDETPPPLEEVTVFASRYAIEAGLSPPGELTQTDIERVPGSHDDALRALHSLPGVVSSASARPYIRGSLTEDVLVRYDGIALLDPFHLKNFQSLISAIDPAAIERIDVFSGGFPVRYGTRSGGVIDIAAPTIDAGREHRASLSMISAGVSSMGRAGDLPLEWLGAIRRSTLDLLDPVEDGFGKPEFADSLGRLRWHTEQGAWSLGWLLLDDRLELERGDEQEVALGRYRDEYVWLAREHRFDEQLDARANLVATSAERGRRGTLLRPGVALGNLDEERSFNGLELSTDWNYRVGPRSSYSFGGAVSGTRADYRYSRHSEFSPEIAATFGRGPVEDLQFSVRPEVVTYSLYASNRRKWSRFEAELGLRFDAQHYENGVNHTQVSPRLNLRQDVSDRLRLYASIGRFTQAQHVEEWRVEEAQQAPDAAQVSVHSIVGLEYDAPSGARIGLEVYGKRWTTVAPYFDNLLDTFALLPDLSPDRVRLRPAESEANGLELNVRRPFGDRLTGWGTLAWARVADDFADGGDVRRSWDQPLSLTAGLAWKGSRASVSALAGWHRGWPRTPFGASPLELGVRNAERWGDFYSLDLRASWNWEFAGGDLSAVLDVTNATNRRNECCLILGMEDALSTHTDHWLPAIVNIGITYRWR